MGNRLEGWLLALVLGTSLALGLVGAGHGLPARYDFDEWEVVESARDFFVQDLNPRWSSWPGHIQMYATYAADAVVYAAMRLTGRVRGAAQFVALYAQDPTAFYLTARVLVGLWTATLPLLTWRLARPRLGSTGAIVAAWWVAICPPAVALAHRARPDTLQAALALGALWIGVLALEPARKSLLVLAGLVAGAAVCAKLPAGAVCVALLLAGWWVDGVKGVLDVGAASVLGLFLTGPYLFLDAQRTAAFLKADTFRASGPGTDRPLWWANVPFYLGGTLSDAMFPGVQVLAAIGLWMAWRRGGRREAVAAAYACVYFLMIFAFHRRDPGWIVPMVPLVAMLAAWPLAWLADGRRGGEARILSLILVAAALGGRALWASVRLDRDLTKVDTRTLAARWIEAHAPAGARIAMDERTLDMDPVRYRCLTTHDTAYRPPEAYARDQDFLAIGSQWFGLFLGECERYPATCAFYRALLARPASACFSAGEDACGPYVRVYDLRSLGGSSLQSPSFPQSDRQATAAPSSPSPSGGSDLAASAVSGGTGQPSAGSASVVSGATASPPTGAPRSGAPPTVSPDLAGCPPIVPDSALARSRVVP